LDAGVRILEYPTMLHAKAFVRDGEELFAGTCNLEAWSLKRFFEIDPQVWSKAVAAEAASSPGRRLTGTKERAKAMVFAASRHCSEHLASALRVAIPTTARLPFAFTWVNQPVRLFLGGQPA